MREEISKTQLIRLLDIPLGIFMVYFGIVATNVPQWAKFTMIIAGILTALYNGINYLKKRKR